MPTQILVSAQNNRLCNGECKQAEVEIAATYNTLRPRESHIREKCLLWQLFGRGWSSWCSLLLTGTINCFTFLRQPKKCV